MSSSPQSTTALGTGTSVSRSASSTRYSRSTAWAEASSSPGGLRRNTYSCSPAVSLKVGLDCPPGNFSALSGPSKPGTLARSQGSSRESSSSCVLMTDLYDVMPKRLFRTVARSGIRSQVLA